MSSLDKKIPVLKSKVMHPARILSKWNKEKCLEDYKEIIPALLTHIKSAKKSIEVEMYIFTLDSCGQPILEALKKAALRGVKVRLAIDGLGSPQFTTKLIKDLFENYGLQAKVYKPLYPFFKHITYNFFCLRWHKIFQAFFNMNKRNHRKLWIFDGKTAVVGSANLNRHYKKWRETVVEVEGPDVLFISKGFEWIWQHSSTMRAYYLPKMSLKDKFLSRLMWVHRWRCLHSRIKLINQAKSSIKLINPYFVPPYYLLVPLIRAARRGVKVEILTSRNNDIFFVSWFARRYYNLLLNKKVKIYEQPKLSMHAKVMIIDKQAIVGSSNYNHRSVNIDLEIDILVSSPSVLRKLNNSWHSDVNHSKSMKPRPQSWWWKKFLQWLWPIKRNS